MADEMYKRYCVGFLPVLPPVAHPRWPVWVECHEANYAVGMVLGTGSVEEGEGKGKGVVGRRCWNCVRLI